MVPLQKNFIPVDINTVSIIIIIIMKKQYIFSKSPKKKKKNANALEGELDL